MPRTWTDRRPRRIREEIGAGKKVILFERAMGIAGFEASQALDGTINVTAQMGFSTEKRDDVAALLDSLPDVSEKSTAQAVAQ